MVNRRIRTTYEIVTPESAAEGDCAESGWEDEEGEEMEPDDVDAEEGKSAVDNAVKFLGEKGFLEASASFFHPGVWYTQADADVDFATGEHRRESYHLSGFTEAEEREIFLRITAF